MKQKNPVIFICDDEPLYCKKIENICREVLHRMEIDQFHIINGYDGGDVFSCQEEIDLLILDIDMPEVDGIQVKNKLCCSRSNCTIIYVTNHGERMREAFGKQVHGFVDKTELADELPLMLKQIFREYNQYVLIQEKYRSRDIRYIEAAHDFCKLYLCDGTEAMIKERISKLTEILEPVDFVLIHRSCLVNMRMMDGIKDGYVKISGQGSLGREFKISARKRKEVLEKWKHYQRKGMGFM